MHQDQWSAVDRYFTERLIPLEAADQMHALALVACAAVGLPPISVAPNQGKLLMLLAMAQRAQRVLEIGTLGGYSTLWLARALPPPPVGRLVTLELDPHHAEVARSNFERAGYSSLIDLRVGPALGTLPSLAGEVFDLVFIDADKAATPDYLAWSLRLTRRGSVIIIDNVVRDGNVIDNSSTDPSVRGVRRLMDMLAAEPRVVASALQTVGVKGYDGFAIALVVAD
jgi:predicted O-methyltransferase YrrM